jgi:threonine dehydrogenase-like Zn-dependent dehydrogenase
MEGDNEIPAEIRRLTNGRGPSITIDTTGNLHLIKSAYEFTGVMGRIVIVVTPGMEARLGVPL